VKFKLDENLPIEATALLRDKGHDVHSVQDEQLIGAVDPSIALVCQQEQRILITIDLDFADIRHYPPSLYPGIIVLRLARNDRDSVTAIMPLFLDLLRIEPVAQRLWIMDESRTRIREEP
jgi:predicted nuclease of predicted toxin-antitoxin system